VVKAGVLNSYFKVGSKEIEQLNYAKNYIGSSLAGSIAHNAHAANVLAASFIAYGQDVAQIVDAVNSVDDVKALENGDLYIAVYLPALEIGTYGGGTHRETAKELLMASGVYGEGDELGKSKYALAELIASGVLAGELNLLAAEAGKELAEAHSKLKR
jgi:hydroxymethylglutaryl-CoA reductase (NADPH)